MICLCLGESTDGVGLQVFSDGRVLAILIVLHSSNWINVNATSNMTSLRLVEPGQTNFREPPLVMQNVVVRHTSL